MQFDDLAFRDLRGIQGVNKAVAQASLLAASGAT